MKRQRIVAAWLACIMAAFVLPFAALAEGGDIAIKLDSGNAALANGDYLSVNVKFDAAVASFGGAEFNVDTTARRSSSCPTLRCLAARPTRTRLKAAAEPACSATAALKTAR